MSYNIDSKHWSMSRRKIIEEAVEDRIEEAEVIMRWSGKRIVIATFTVILIIAGGLYAISLLSQNNSQVLGQKSSDKPQIELPDDSSVQKVIDKAKEDLSNISAKNIISSQPKIQQIIDDLSRISTASVSAKSLICDAICK